MTLKAKMSLLVFLTSLSIVSIGFSSWSITAETTAEINGNIEVDNVIRSDKYIKLDTTKGENQSGKECFKFQENGYLADDGATVTGKGYIKSYFTLDLEKCSELFIGDYKSLKIDAKLRYTEGTQTSLNIFKDIKASNGQSSMTASCKIEDYNIAITTKNTKGSENVVEYNSSFTFNNLLSFYEANQSVKEINFSINYELVASTGDFFREQIFEYLYKDMIDSDGSFKLELAISAI